MNVIILQAHKQWNKNARSTSSRLTKTCSAHLLIIFSINSTNHNSKFYTMTSTLVAGPMHWVSLTLSRNRNSEMEIHCLSLQILQLTLTLTTSTGHNSLCSKCLSASLQPAEDRRRTGRWLLTSGTPTPLALPVNSATRHVCSRLYTTHVHHIWLLQVSCMANCRNVASAASKK